MSSSFPRSELDIKSALRKCAHIGTPIVYLCCFLSASNGNTQGNESVPLPELLAYETQKMLISEL